MFSIFLIILIGYLCMWYYINQQLYKTGNILKINLRSLRFTRKADLQVFEDVNLKKETYKQYRIFYFLFFGDYNYKKFSRRIQRDVFYVNNFKHNEYDYNQWKNLENKISIEGYAPKGEKDYLIVSKDLCIMEGHHRAEVLKNLGYEDILVRVTNLTYSKLVFYKHLQYFPLLFIVNIIKSLKRK